MKVLVDTSIWSQALRRRQGRVSHHAEELAQLIHGHRVVMIGPVRQELLSGIRNREEFNRLEKHLAPFPDLPVTTEDHFMAAQYFNQCRASGVQSSNTDFLICAVAVRNQLAIYTADRDFTHYAHHLPVLLYQPGSMPVTDK